MENEIIASPRYRDAIKEVFDYTSSSKWEEVESLVWTTAEVVALMTVFKEKSEPLPIHKEKMREVLIEYSPYTRNAVFGIPNDKEHRERLKVMDERIVDNFLKEREG